MKAASFGNRKFPTLQVFKLRTASFETASFKPASFQNKKVFIGVGVRLFGPRGLRSSRDRVEFLNCKLEKVPFVNANPKRFGAVRKGTFLAAVLKTYSARKASLSGNHFVRDKARHQDPS